MTTSDLDDRIDDVAREIMRSAPRSDLKMRVLSALGSPDRERRSRRIAIWWMLAPAAGAILFVLVSVRNPTIPTNVPTPGAAPRISQAPLQPTAAAATPQAPIAMLPRRVARANRRLNERVDEHVPSDIDPSALLIDPIDVPSLPALEPLDAPPLSWRQIDVAPIVVDDVSDKRQELK